MLKSCLNIQSNHVVSKMFNSIKIVKTKILRIQKKEDIKDKKNMLYIIVIQTITMHASQILKKSTINKTK